MCQRIKDHRCNATIHLSRAIVLAGIIAASLMLYFLLSLYVLPQSYQLSAKPPMPKPVVTLVEFSASQITLGQALTVTVAATNAGDRADLQLVSIGFPNITSATDIKVIRSDYRQILQVNAGDEVGSGYVGLEQSVIAPYASVEALSRPWESGSNYSISLEVQPKAQGNFVVLVKSVALPHTWNGAHYPTEGTADYQREFVHEYYVNVTNA